MLDDRAGAGQTDRAAACADQVVERQPTRTGLQQDVAGRCSHGVGNRHQRRTTRHQHDVAGTGRRQVILYRVAGCNSSASCIHAIGLHGDTGQRDRTGFGKIRAARTSMRGQRPDRDRQMVAAAADCVACIQQQSGCTDSTDIAFDDVAGVGRDADIAAACCQCLDRDIGTSLQHLIAIRCRDAGTGGHGDVACSQYIDRVAAARYRDRCVLQHVVCRVQADVASAGDAAVDDDISCCADRFQQQVTARRDAVAVGVAIVDSDAASCRDQHHVATRGDVRNARIGDHRSRAIGCRARDRHRVHCIDRHVSSHVQIQATVAGACHVRCQFCYCDLQMRRAGAHAVAGCGTGRHDAQLRCRDIDIGGARVGDAAGAQTDIAAGAQGAHRHRRGRCVTDVADCRGGGAIGHRDAVGSRFDRAATGGRHVGVLCQRTAGRQCDRTGTGVDQVVERNAARQCLQQQIAAGGRDVAADDDVARGRHQRHATAAASQVALRCIGGGCNSAGCIDAIGLHRHATDGQPIGFGDEQATAAGVGRERCDRGVQRIGTATDADASIQNQAIGIDVDRRSAGQIGIDDAAGASRNAGATAACVQDFQRHRITGLQHDVAVGGAAGDAACHGDVTTCQQIDRLAGGCGTDRSVLQDVLTSVEAGVADAVGNRCANRDVTASLH